VADGCLVRLEPTLIELEREQEDLLIIGHASVIRCLLAYLIGLPASEIPAIEVARGDLLEVVPASYGVESHALHFWDGPGRKHDGDHFYDEHAGGGTQNQNNFYENYAEDTRGKRPPTLTEEEGGPIRLTARMSLFGSSFENTPADTPDTLPSV
jgi:6-phosphofructo-2-kinase/fructose-2,6-biphosphatase 4